MEYPHLTANRKVRVKGLIGPGNGGFSYDIDDRRVLATDAGLHSLTSECLELRQWSEMTHIPENEDAPGRIMILHATLVAEWTKLWLPIVRIAK